MGSKILAKNSFPERRWLSSARLSSLGIAQVSISATAISLCLQQLRSSCDPSTPVAILVVLSTARKQPYPRPLSCLLACSLKEGITFCSKDLAYHSGLPTQVPSHRFRKETSDDTFYPFLVAGHTRSTTRPPSWE
jgi:hypothetical protein